MDISLRRSSRLRQLCGHMTLVLPGSRESIYNATVLVMFRLPFIAVLDMLWFSTVFPQAYISSACAVSTPLYCPRSCVSTMSFAAAIAVFCSVRILLRVLGPVRCGRCFLRRSWMFRQSSRVCSTVPLPWLHWQRPVGYPGTLWRKRKSGSPILPVRSWMISELSGLGVYSLLLFCFI